MNRHGRETVCCGSGAICWFSESCSRIRKERLQEAAKTGADRLVTVCHYCNQTFAAEESSYNFSVTNYVNLVAKAVGIRREDKFKKYSQWRHLIRILKDADQQITASPFKKDHIVEVLKATFIG
jgi:Fe-S oxidoreductase